jgi:hypothetical protein
VTGQHEEAYTLLFKAVAQLVLRYLPLGLFDPGQESLVAEEARLLEIAQGALGKPTAAASQEVRSAFKRLNELWNQMEPRYPQYVAFRRQQTITFSQAVALVDDQVTVLIDRIIRLFSASRPVRKCHVWRGRLRFCLVGAQRFVPPGVCAATRAITSDTKRCRNGIFRSIWLRARTTGTPHLIIQVGPIFRTLAGRIPVVLLVGVPMRRGVMVFEGGGTMWESSFGPKAIGRVGMAEEEGARSRFAVFHLAYVLAVNRSLAL